MTDKAGWVRDTHTGAVISVDTRAQAEYRARLIKLKETQAKIANINTLENRIDHLEKMISAITKDK
jgi:hypothetical protein